MNYIVKDVKEAIAPYTSLVGEWKWLDGVGIDERGIVWGVLFGNSLLKYNF
jgi:hypothetical protein